MRASFSFERAGRHPNDLCRMLSLNKIGAGIGGPNVGKMVPLCTPMRGVALRLPLQYDAKRGENGVGIRLRPCRLNLSSERSKGIFPPPFGRNNYLLKLDPNRNPMINKRRLEIPKLLKGIARDLRPAFLFTFQKGHT